MLVLDTDHLSAVERYGQASPLLRRLDESLQDIGITIVSVEEQLRGWLSQLHRHSRNVYEQIPIYGRLQKNLEFVGSIRTLGWDNTAADHFTELRRQGIRIGSMDLKIASIVLARGGTLLTANLTDFKQVPNLQAENWLV